MLYIFYDKNFKKLIKYLIMSNIYGFDIVLKKIEDHKITAYEIAKGTGLSIFGVQKVINRETKKPNSATILKISKFVEEKIAGSRLPGHPNYNPEYAASVAAEEEPTPLQDLSIYKDYVEALKKNAILEGEIIRLKELLDTNGINHEN